MTGPKELTDLPSLPTLPAGGDGSLFARVSALIEEARQAVATYTNVALTLTFWRIGHLIDLEVLGQQRADYGGEVVASLGRELSWTHFKTLLPLKSADARDYYARQVAAHHLSVRGLQKLISRKTHCPLSAGNHRDRRYPAEPTARHRAWSTLCFGTC
ncbi:MAG: hypothetical protein LBK59_06625 [Bifidobacteriaceae bacterium]|jgi:hypothetical protein|nr:hypothetical protein [Bifidobacteriaceae bacterium]